MQRRLLIPAILLIAASIVVHASRAPDQLDSLVVCRQTQKLIFENAFVRVIDDVIPPGISEPKHRHPHGVVIALEDADTETRLYPDGRAMRRHTIKGTAGWNEAIIHEVKNVGSKPTHFVRIDSQPHPSSTTTSDDRPNMRRPQGRISIPLRSRDSDV